MLLSRLRGASTNRVSLIIFLISSLSDSFLCFACSLSTLLISGFFRLESSFISSVCPFDISRVSIKAEIVPVGGVVPLIRTLLS